MVWPITRRSPALGSIHLTEAASPRQRRSALMQSRRTQIRHSGWLVGQPDCWCQESFTYLFRLTTATLFTPLHARYSCPPGVATILRTTPPPDGITFVLNVSDLGSNRTMVFGFRPDSLYQTWPSFVIAIPYGSDSAPPGDNHSFNS